VRTTSSTSRQPWNLNILPPTTKYLGSSCCEVEHFNETPSRIAERQVKDSRDKLPPELPYEGHLPSTGKFE